MIQITPQMRVLVAVEPVHFSLWYRWPIAAVPLDSVGEPVHGTVFVFRSRRGTAIKWLVYDGQSFWLAQKRLSAGKFRHWPTAAHAASSPLLAHEFQALLWGGDPTRAQAAPLWRRLDTQTAQARAA